MKAYRERRDYPLPLPLHWLALSLNAFSFVTANICIYWARWVWISHNPDARPPTISWAISDPSVGPVFAFWVTLSGLCLVFGVLLLVWHHIGLLRRCPEPSTLFVATIWIGAFAVTLLQPLSALGMFWLSAYRLPFAAETHMIGSYLFFSAQACVILVYTVMNFVLLRDAGSLSALESKGLITRKWVKIRLVSGLITVALVLAYLALFIAKDTYTYADYPGFYRTYVSVEPIVITGFLLVLLLCHVDMRRK